MSIVIEHPPGDLQVVNGRFVRAEGLAIVRQRLAARFDFFLGEWFLDTLEGVPYYRDVFGANPSLDTIRSIFRQVILTTPGVLSIRRFDLVFDSPSRTLRFNFEAIAQGGSIVVAPDDEDFVISV